jgi:hypothetical protein
MTNRQSWAYAGVFLLLCAWGAGCKTESPPSSAMPAKITNLAELADAVSQSGPREGNNYKVFFKVLRQNQQPAAGFEIDAWVKGKSEPKTVVTDEDGIAIFPDLPFPETRNQLMAVFRYFNGKQDASREITYPYIDSDAYRLKDTQYIPNAATAELPE